MAINSNLTDHLEKLRYFAEVASAGSFGKASRLLRISQPSLSHSIQVLEGVLSTELLVRTSRGVQLTPAGQRLLDFSHKLIEETSSLEHELRLGNEKAVTFSIGTKEPYAVSVWPEYLRLMRAKHPDMEVSLSVEKTNQRLIDRLTRQEIDAAFFAEPPEDECLVAFEVFAEHFGFYSAPKILSTSPSLFIFRRSFCGGKRTINDVLRENHFRELQPITEVDSFPAAKAMALAGLGLALLPHFLAQPELATRRLKASKVDGLSASLFGNMKVCLCVHKKDMRNKRLREMIRLIRNVH